MAHIIRPIEEGTGSEIYDMMVRYVAEHKMLPNPHAMWLKVIVGMNNYQVSRGCFDYHWLRFQIAGLVEVDPLTKAYKLAGVDLVVKKT